MVEMIGKLRETGVEFGIVSGSDLTKVTNQVGKEFAMSADYCFAENGLDAYESGKQLER